jgi:hypothetical protein
MPTTSKTPVGEKGTDDPMLTRLRDLLHYTGVTAIVGGILKIQVTGYRTRFIQSTAVLLAALALAGCAAHVAVTADYERSVNFAALRTYGWRPGAQQEVGDPRFDNTLLDMRVRAAVDRVLSARGYQKAAPGTMADFLVGYHAVVRQKTTFQTVNRRYGYRVGVRGSWPQAYVHDYDEGTLLIDIIDPANMDLLWRGTGTGVVDPQASPEKRERRINEAVDAILAKFPPS